MTCWGSTTSVETWTARKSHLCRCTRRKHLAEGTAQASFLHKAFLRGKPAPTRPDLVRPHFHATLIFYSTSTVCNCYFDKCLFPLSMYNIFQGQNYTCLLKKYLMPVKWMNEWMNMLRKTSQIQGRRLCKFITEYQVKRFGSMLNSKTLGTEMHQHERHRPDF